MRMSGFSSDENYSAVTAVRKLGPSDTTQTAIVFYSGTGVTDYQINEKLANGNITVSFSLASHVIITYGSSNWTLFEGKEFIGKTACLETPEVVRLSHLYESHLNLTKVGSIIKGCDLKRGYIEEVRRNWLKGQTDY